MQAPRSQAGLTLVEMLAALALFAAVAILTAPPLLEIVRNSRLKAASSHLVGEIQQARSRAVGTGWQHRITGYSAGSSAVRRNQYRWMTRSSTGVAWPAITVPASQGTSLTVSDWIDLGTIYPGVEINPADSGVFALTFDTRGSPTEMSLNFNPLQISADSGERWLNVSSVGGVHVD